MQIELKDTAVSAMRHAIAGIGLVAFAAVSLLHVVSVDRIAGSHIAGFRWIPLLVAGVFWLAFLTLVVWGMYRTRIRSPVLILLAYGIAVAVAGTVVLDGSPSTIDRATWSDPNYLLTPDTKYLLHNRRVVKKALSEEEYERYCTYELAYFSGIGMVLCAAAALAPLDRNGQLFKLRGRN
jgi:hypothetical protein